MSRSQGFGRRAPQRPTPRRADRKPAGGAGEPKQHVATPRRPKKNASHPPVYLGAVLVMAALVGWQFFAPEGGWRAGQFLATGGVLGLTAIKLFRISTRSEPDRRDFLEAGLLLLLSVQVLVQASGGLGSPALPAMYLLVALLAAYTDGLSTACFVVVATALHLPQVFSEYELVQWQIWGGSLGMFTLTVGAFAFVVGSFVRVERRRRQQAVQVLARFQDDASALAAELQDPDDEYLKPALQRERDRRMREATLALDDSLFNLLDTTRHALGAYSVIYFRYEASKERLRIRQMATRSDHVIEEDLDARAGGPLAGVVKARSPVSLADVNNKTPPYYTRSEPVRTVTAVPVLEDSVLRGVLVADHTEADAFAGEGVELLQGFARTVAELERDARERELHAMRAHRLAHYFETSKRLTSTLALEEVLSIAISACRELAVFDFAAIVESEESTGHLIIRKADGEYEGRLTNRNATAQGSLVGWVIRNSQYLPVPHFRKRQMRTPLFGKRLDPDGIRSALLFPLAREGQTVGAFVVGSLSRDQFSHDEVQLLEGVANQTALAMANAILYLRMQEMATTDGLTGLPNHRFFQEQLSKELDRAQRQDGKVSLILMDVDHFKSVNDNYGHPVGDDVLRTVSRILRQVAQRTIDLPARYGGEEFVLVLPDTDARGARRVADKIRAAIAKERFDDGSGGTFQVTMSAGVCAYPGDGDHKQTLIDRADKALYHSKESGRNRTTLWKELSSTSEAAPEPSEPAVLPKQEPG